jgi:ribulose-phosphate 3-epimerase
MHDVIPGILEKNWIEIEKKLQILRPFSRSVHIDVVDGKFAQEVSFLETEPFKKYKDDFFMEVHLMVENPLAYLKEYADAGFKRFLGHVEKMENLEEFIALGQIFGEVGIALDCDTAVESLNIPFDDIDTILLMSVKAGKSGQEFMPDVLEKIKNIKLKTQIPVEIDGGINDKTIIEVKNLGAQRFVATSFIFSSSDPMQSFEKLTSLS